MGKQTSVWYFTINPEIKQALGSWQPSPHFKALQGPSHHFRASYTRMLNTSHPWFICLSAFSPHFSSVSRLPLQLPQSLLLYLKVFLFSLFLDVNILHICPRDSPLQTSGDGYFHKVCEKMNISRDKLFLCSSKYFMSLCHVPVLFLHFLRYAQRSTVPFQESHVEKLSFFKNFQKINLKLPQTLTVSHGQRSQPP